MRGDRELGLGGMVAMTGVPQMMAQAGTCVLSWSVLGLDGSSEDRKRGVNFIAVGYFPLWEQGRHVTQTTLSLDDIWLKSFLPTADTGAKTLSCYIQRIINKTFM